jgi:hypothetical protein
VEEEEAGEEDDEEELLAQLPPEAKLRALTMSRGQLTEPQPQRP